MKDEIGTDPESLSEGTTDALTPVPTFATSGVADEILRHALLLAGRRPHGPAADLIRHRIAARLPEALRSYPDLVELVLSVAVFAARDRMLWGMVVALKNELDAAPGPAVRYSDTDAHAIPGECPTCDGYATVDDEHPIACPKCSRGRDDHERTETR